ncbi:TlpA family protein disulfide reductase [Silvibacterium dinghuense]|uniref:TlpA family protein disulfide reductase n=1 Tax=Silvibacterium dinghuense TaxID=1560006 RepID=A0A4Q1SIA8_9BACT|nr:TlpA disulfide reductase family protein [Silvibacterium dinghuense]RXS97127.1 TlpA family protein disulfide reductase [Silvibacterium dinghuense]GGG96457.1 thiol:disulfide interchange protein [Silvibacterium dinghuense]
MKRNAIVLVVVILALVVMVWAGVVNYRHRKAEEAKLREMQGMLVKLGPPSAPSPASQAEANDPANHPLVGQVAPAFVLKDITGKKVSLADYKGKAVVIDFWATWCAPCKVEIPWLTKFHDQYAPQGLEILGVSEDDLDAENKAGLEKQEKDVADGAGKLGINYPVLLDEKNVAKPYGGIEALPTTFFVGRDGKVVASAVGLTDRDELEADIKKALATPAGQS